MLPFISANEVAERNELDFRTYLLPGESITPYTLRVGNMGFYYEHLSF